MAIRRSRVSFAAFGSFGIKLEFLNTASQIKRVFIDFAHRR